MFVDQSAVFTDQYAVLVTNVLVFVDQSTVIVNQSLVFVLSGWDRTTIDGICEAGWGGDRSTGRSLGEVHLCCIAHKTKNAVRTITSNIIETGIWSKSAPQIPFGSFNTLRSFTGAVLPAEASK